MASGLRSHFRISACTDGDICPDTGMIELVGTS